MYRLLAHTLALTLALCASVHAAESPLLRPAAPRPPAETALAASAYFVSPDGADKNDGRSPEKPFKTIARAAAVAGPGDTVYLRAGVYRETVRPANSGTPEQPITFTSYPGERAQISGADLLPKSWSAQKDKEIYATYVHGALPTAGNAALQVFVDGQMMNLARWPNTSLDISHPTKSAITAFISKNRDAALNLTTGVVEDTALAAANIDAQGAEIFFQPNTGAWSWTFTGHVTAQDRGRLTFVSPNDTGKDGSGKVYAVGSRYYLFNTPALLDAPGEWYFDAKTRQLSLITPDRDDPAKHRVEVKRREWAFDLDERSNIIIRDLDLFACSITTDRHAGGDAQGYRADGSTRYPWRGANSGIAPATNILISGIKAEYLSHFTDLSGHFFLQWGQNTGIVLSGRNLILRDSVLRYSAGNGVTVMGKGNFVLNNLILDTDYAGIDCAAVNTGGAAVTLDHEIAYNTIARCGRSGITPRALANSNPEAPLARIHHNDIFHCMLQDWDGGGLYTAAGDGGFLRIDHNLAHDIDGFNNSGLYTDYAKNYILDHNVIWNAEWGIQIQGYAKDRDGKEVNNTLCFNNTILVTNTSGAPYGPFGFAGSKGGNVGSIIANNLIGITKKTPGWAPFASGYGSAEKFANRVWEGTDSQNPRFRNAAAGDFTLAEGSPAIGAAKPLEAVKRDGVTVPPFAADTPPHADQGALPSNAEPWQAGCDLPERPTLAPWGPVSTHGKMR